MNNSQAAILKDIIDTGKISDEDVLKNVLTDFTAKFSAKIGVPVK